MTGNRRAGAVKPRRPQGKGHPCVKRHHRNHRNECVCVLAHGGVNRVILTEAMGLPIENFFRIEQDYGCLNVIDYFDDGCPVVKLVNGGPNQELRPAMIY